jgi:hypothetical protein
VSYDRTVTDDGSVVTSEVRWRFTSAVERSYEVVRVTTIVERLAGPFKTKRQAEKAIAGGAQPLGGMVPSGARPRQGSNGDGMAPTLPPSWGFEVAPEGHNCPPPPFTGAAADGARYWPTDKARMLLDVPDETDAA